MMSLLYLREPLGSNEGPIAVAERPATTATRPKQSRVRLWTSDEIRKLPAPAWLVENVLVERSVSALYGRHASFKSFVALDFAFSVATGLPWAGRTVQRGDVVYLAGEGSGGLPRRMQAWEKHHQASVDNLHFIISPMSFLDANAVSGLITAIQDLSEPPVLFVLDTLARCFGGGDENSTRDMSAFVAAIDHLREQVGCAVLVVHHAPHAGGKLRGSSALPGALDTIIAVNREATGVTLQCGKQKEAPEFDHIRLEATTVQLTDGASSLVLLPREPSITGPQSECPLSDREQMRIERQRVLLGVLESFGPSGASATEWQKAGEAAEVSRATFYRDRNELKEEGRIEVQHDGTGPRYRLVSPAALPEDDVDDCFGDADRDAEESFFASLDLESEEPLF